MRAFWAISGVLYLLLVGLIIYGFHAARENATFPSADAESQNAWEDWRETVTRDQKGESPVERSIPRSTEPPTLVLLRDHFWTSLAGALCMTSALYWTIAFFIRGTVSGPTFKVDMK